jgi:hydrogenase-4 component B
MIASAVSLAAAIAHLLGAAAPESITLPVGVPWLGAHLRIDALSAFFLVVVDLGAMSASLFALGYGQHETAPERVLPFYPAFLAA